MAAASLLIRISGAVDNSLKGGVDQATRELNRLKTGAAEAGDRMLNLLPPTFNSEIKNIGTAIGGLASKFGGLGGVMAAVGVAQLFDDFLTTTGALVDLSSQTDVTIRDLQRFKFAGEQVGVSLDEIVRGVGALDRQLGSGDKGAIKALGDLGLKVKDLLALDPGQRFEAVGVAISKIEDPTKRAAIAQELFLKGGIGLMPLFRSNLKEVGDQTALISDRTVKAADKFDDLFGRMKNFGKGVVAEGLFGPIVKWVEDIGEAFDDVGRSIDAVRGKMDTLPKVPGSPLQSNGPAPTPAFDFAEAMRLSDQLTESVERQQRAHAENGRAAAAAARIAADAAKELRREAGELVERGIKLQMEAERELFGASVQSGLIASVRDSRTEILITLPVLHDWASENGATTQTLLDMTAAGLHLKDVGPQIFEGMRDSAARTSTPVVSLRDNISDLAQAMTQLSQTVGSSVVDALASMVNGMNVGFKAVGNLKLGFSELTSGKGLSSILSGFTGIVGGISGLISAAQTAIQIGKALFDIFDRNKGRDLVVSFAESFGGFDALHKRLNQFGDEGERMWIALTQGVGRNNPDQARRIIEEIEEAFKGLTSTVRKGVDEVIHDLEGQEITLPINFDVQTLHLPGIEVPELATGGIVTRPTLALVGEAGPEAVVPLGRLGTGGDTGGGDTGIAREIQGLRQDMKWQEIRMFKAIRDAVQTA